MVSFYLQAQRNLEVIEHFEALKIISSHTFNLTSTPIIAIIDNGVNNKHEDLVHNIWVNRYEIPANGIDDDQNGFIDDINGWNFSDNSNNINNNGLGNWHGTPINGIIGAENDNSIGVQGVSPKVELMNIVKGDSVKSIIESLKYIYWMRNTYNQTNGEKGAYIVAVNCSWGKSDLTASDYPEWCSMYDRLGKIGVLSVHSAPNENVNIDVVGDMPSSCSSDYIISVTNSNIYDEKVFDSGYGMNNVDLAAPGDFTYTTLNSGSYGHFDGTSASAPYVTGVIGLLYLLPSKIFQQDIRENISKSAKLIKSVLMKGVNKIADFERTTVSGGRLNAFNSMKLLCDHYGQSSLYESIFNPMDILSVYPNPATTSAILKLESNSVLNLTISFINIKGQVVRTEQRTINKGISTISIEVGALEKGVYIIQIKSNHATKNTKLIVQ